LDMDATGGSGVGMGYVDEIKKSPLATTADSTAASEGVLNYAGTPPAIHGPLPPVTATRGGKPVCRGQG